MSGMVKKGVLVVVLMSVVPVSGCVNKEIKNQPTESKVLNDSNVVYEDISEYPKTRAGELYGKHTDKYVTQKLKLYGNDKIKEIKYQSTESKVLDGSNVVYEYVSEYPKNRVGELYDKHTDKYITQSLELYVNDEISIYEVKDYTYSEGIVLSQIVEHNYYTGEDTVLEERYIDDMDKMLFGFLYTPIVFDDDTIIYSYDDKLEQCFIKSININSKEQETIKIVDDYNYVGSIKKLDDDNIVVMYAIDLNPDWKSMVEIINVNTKESKVLYETMLYETEEIGEEYKILSNGCVAYSFCIDNGEIVILNTYKENNSVVGNTITIVDRDGNIVNEYDVDVDITDWSEIGKECYSAHINDVENVNKINDYVSVQVPMSNMATVNLMYKIVGDKLVQLKMPSDFYDRFEMDEISQMNLDKRYFVWTDRKYYDEQKQDVIVFDTENGKLHKIEVDFEGALEDYSIYGVTIGYDDKMLIQCTNDIDGLLEKKEIIVDINELGL